MRYLLPLFECEIETMMLKTKYYSTYSGAYPFTFR